MTTRRGTPAAGDTTWTDIFGNLPDVPGDDLIITHGKLVLATDIDVFVADARTPTRVR